MGSLNTRVQRQFALSLAGFEGIAILRKSCFEFFKASGHRLVKCLIVGVHGALNSRIGSTLGDTQNRPMRDS